MSRKNLKDWPEISSNGRTGASTYSVKVVRTDSGSLVVSNQQRPNGRPIYDRQGNYMCQGVTRGVSIEGRPKRTFLLKRKVAPISEEERDWVRDSLQRYYQTRGQPIDFIEFS